MLTSKRLLVFVACATLLAGAAHGQRPLNLDMEQPGIAAPAFPWGWYSPELDSPAAEREARIDSTVRHGGRRSLRIERTRAGSPAWFGVSDLSTKSLTGRRIRLTGWARTERLQGGAAALRVEMVGGDYQPIRVDSMPDAGLRGTTGWTRLALETVMDTSAAYLVVGMQVSGTGTAWFDDLVLEVDGRRIAAEPGPARATAAERAWLRSRAVPLGSQDAPRMEPFRAVVGDARVVSLGEGTHGTREFFQLKHRLIEHLVERMGFGVVMLEANQLQTERVNRYVLTGEGTAREAMSGLFKVLQTEEVLAMVEWLRAWNASGKRPVEVVGYDMQDPRLPIDSVLAFVRRSDPAFLAAADSAYDAMRTAWLPGPYPDRPDSAVRRWQASADVVRRHLASRAPAYLERARTRADSVSIAWALQNAEVAYQASSLGNSTPFRVRDSTMALNVRWSLAQRPAGTRAVVWAHNSHVSRAPEWMGTYLERLLPGQVRVVGFTTAQGEYSAFSTWGRDTRTRQVGVFRIAPVPPPAGSVAAELFSLGAPLAIVDLRGAAGAAGGRWLAEPRPFLSIGGRAVDYGYHPTPLAAEFDALIYVPSTTAARPLP
ncbi:MAG TPA: erythromycin esterase family protein [Longimicrobium sp.]|jgi:erythromycin esterase